jgi:hypothetical protein
VIDREVRMDAAHSSEDKPTARDAHPLSTELRGMLGRGSAIVV